jgi:hypothetical protein
LIAASLAAALRPEYPMPMTEAASTSAEPRIYLLPTAITPVGDAERPLWFAWEWHGPALDWQLVVCGADLTEIAREAVGKATGHCPSPALQALLEAHGRCHWYAAATLQGAPFHTPPIAVDFSR